MGRKWLNAMKKVLHSDSKEKTTQDRVKSKKKWFRKKKKRSSNPKSPKAADMAPITTAPTPTTPASPAATPSASVSPQEPTNQVEREQPQQTVKPEAAKELPKHNVAAKQTDKKDDTKKHAYNVSVASAKAAEAAITAAQAAAEVVRLTAAASRFAGLSLDDISAIKIQAAFRGYMARRTLRALQGVMRLKTTMQGPAVKRQTKNTLKYMQTLARVQGEVRQRRLKTSEDNQARKIEIQLKYEKDQPKGLDKSEKSGDGWDSSGKTKDQIEAKLQIKHEAAIRRERTLAYAYTHQQPWKPTPKAASTMFMDPNTTHWGWSWLERWLAATTNDNSITDQKPSIPKQQNRSPKGRLSTSSNPSMARKVRSPSPRASPKVSPRGSTWGVDDEIKSMLSNSLDGSNVEDDEDGDGMVPSFMASTKSTKAKTRAQDRVSVSSTKMRHSYSPSPAKSRPSISDANSILEQIN